jgi:hypothetical protein
MLTVEVALVYLILAHTELNVLLNFHLPTAHILEKELKGPNEVTWMSAPVRLPPPQALWRRLVMLSVSANSPPPPPNIYYEAYEIALRLCVSVSLLIF